MEETVYDIISVNYFNSTINENEHKTQFYNNLTKALCVVVIIVNFSVVLSSGFLLKKGQQPRATYIYLGNISLSDMVIGIVTLFISFYPHQFHNDIVCSLTTSLGVMGAFASAYSIGLIAIDRYLYILYGLHYHRYFTTRHSYCVVSLIWFMGLVIGFAGTFIWRFPMKGHACWYTLLVPTKVGLFMIFVEIIPMVLIVVVYGIILKNAINAISRTNNCPSVNHLHPETNSRNQQRCKDGEIQIISCSVNDQLPSSKRLSLFGLPCCRRSSINLAISRPKFCKNKWKAVKIVVFTAGAYVVTWFPTFVAWVLYANCDLETDFEYCEKLANLLTNPLSFMILSNSLIDPVIYAWWHPGFRKSAKKMYSMFLRTKESSRTGNRTSEPKTSSLNRKGEF